MAATNAIKAKDGQGIPTVKPWDINTLKEKLALIQASDSFAVAMDIDAAGLPFLPVLPTLHGSRRFLQVMIG